MSTFDDHIDPSRLSTLPPLPRDEGGPVFAEPWQAQAFALAVKLSDAGWFTWKEWAAALALELRAAAERGEPDDGSHYYEHWTAALEKLVQARGLLDEAALIERKEAWADAYRQLPTANRSSCTQHTASKAASELNALHRSAAQLVSRFDLNHRTFCRHSTQ